MRLVLVMLGRCWQLIEFLVLLHANLRRNHWAWRVFNAVFQIVLRIVNILLFSHVWAMTMTHVRASHWHLSHSTYRPNLINGRAIIVVRMSWMIGPHGCSRFWRFTAMSVSGLWMGSIVVWSVHLTLHCFFLFFKLAVCSYQLIYFRLTDFIEPRLG